MLKLLTPVLMVLLTMNYSYSSELKTSQPLLYYENDEVYAIFNLSWKNAWYSERNYDAAWIFFKTSLPKGSQHIRVLAEGHQVVSSFSSSDPALTFEVPADRTGMFVHPLVTFRGDIEATLKIRLDPDSFEGVDRRRTLLTAVGIEMVKIPEGAFQLGDPDTASLKFGAMYQPDGKGGVSGLVTISSESDAFRVGEDGDLYYHSPSSYEGDQTGTIPSAFPKGVRGFYIMKYEVPEGLYVNFLNSLDSSQAALREVHEEIEYQALNGTIRRTAAGYITETPMMPCRLIGWADGIAFADWAGLRPMTEFEFTKACRGPNPAIAREYPWNSDQKSHLLRLPDSTGLLMRNGWDEKLLDDQNKQYFGASRYWVMDLAGSIWERVISIGHPNGRAFTGIHGDGSLAENGEADVPDWPDAAEESGGVGFRGGGFYGYDRVYTEYNPFSPIAYRRFGGWHGTMRSVAYGQRFVRSVTN